MLHYTIPYFPQQVLVKIMFHRAIIRLIVLAVLTASYWRRQTQSERRIERPRVFCATLFSAKRTAGLPFYERRKTKKWKWRDIDERVKFYPPSRRRHDVRWFRADDPVWPPSRGPSLSSGPNGKNKNTFTPTRRAGHEVFTT